MTTSIDFTPYLESIGMKVNRVTGTEINAWCPAHIERTGQHDRKPSFYFNQIRQVGHCFSCDWRVPSLEVLVEYLTGAPPEQDVVIEAREASLYNAVRQLGKAKKNLIDDRRVLEWQFQQLAPVPDKLLEFRRLSRAMADFFQVRFDTINRCWVLPIHSPRGELLGWQQRQKGAVYNYPKGIQKATTLFGLHRFDENRLVLVESPLDAVRLYQIGVAAVASFGAEVSNKQVELLARNCSEVIVALDNDAAGQKAAERVLSQLRKRVGAVPWRYEGRIKDVGEYPTDDALTSAWNRTLRYGW
jgi:DNA primase